MPGKPGNSHAIMMPDNLQTIRDMIRWAVSRFNNAGLFYGHGTDNALDEALAMTLHVLSLDYSLPDNYLDCRLTDREKQNIAEIIDQRIQTRKPLSYLTGTAWFAGMQFRVNEHVLVPRSPIAELIAEGFYPWVEPENVHHVLDLCTGSGCIGIATAARLPQVEVLLSDISNQALAVARQNIEMHGLQNRIRAIKSDVYEKIPEVQFDLIISNPPYVSEQEYQQLPAEYHREPKLGLTAEENGMSIVARILRDASRYLSDDGVIIIEVGASAELLMDRYPQIDFNWIEFENGGDGVFIMNREQLENHQQDF